MSELYTREQMCNAYRFDCSDDNFILGTAYSLAVSTLFSQQLNGTTQRLSRNIARRFTTACMTKHCISAHRYKIRFKLFV
jgi:hypothetical protein